MHKPITATLLAAASLYAPSALAQSADCAEIATLPATITQPGKYCLAQDFTVNSSTIRAITIAANDVELDCKGHTIRNLATSNTGTSEGIFANARNSVTVRGCKIQGGFTNGISFLQDNTQPNRTYYVTIENNYIAGPFAHGIRAYGSALEIRHNRVYDIGGQLNSSAIGIRVGGTTLAAGPKFHLVHDNVIAGTNAPNSNAFGIYSDVSLASLFWMNDVTGTTAQASNFRSYGIRVAGNVNSIKDNHIVGSPLANDIGVYGASPSTECFDNDIRSPQPTVGCDASLGNY